MKITWNNKWKSVLIWLSAYLNFIAFVLVGGYFYVKNEDEKLQNATKNAFIVTLVFTAINAFLSLFNYVAGFMDNYYLSNAYEFYSNALTIVSIAKIVVFAVFVILVLVSNDNSDKVIAADTTDTE